jgi:hypothetical protein
MTKQTLIFLIIIFLFSFGIGVWLRAKSEKKTTKTSPLNPTTISEAPPLPSPAIDNHPTYTVGVRGNFPATVRLLKTTPIDEPAFTATIASKMGFTVKPTTISGLNGIVYQWNNERAVLTASGAPTRLSFALKSLKIAGSIQPSLSDYETKARQILSQNGLLFDDYQYVVEKPTLFGLSKGNKGEVSEPSKASVVQINFVATQNGLPVLTNDAGTPSIWIQLDPNGQVVAFNAVVLPRITVENEAFPIVDIEEANSRLSSGIGTLSHLSTTTKQADLVILNSAPENIDINSAALGYFYSPDQRWLRPVFSYKGVGSKDNQSIETISLVSAEITPR